MYARSSGSPLIKWHILGNTNVAGITYVTYVGVVATLLRTSKRFASFYSLINSRGRRLPRFRRNRFRITKRACTCYPLPLFPFLFFSRGVANLFCKPHCAAPSSVINRNDLETCPSVSFTLIQAMINMLHAD